MGIEVEVLGVVFLFQQHHRVVDLLGGVVFVAGTVGICSGRYGRVLCSGTVEDLPGIEEVVAFL